MDQPYTFANDEHFSENEGGSEDGSDGPEGREEEGAGRREPVVGDERNGANIGENMEGAGYSHEDDDSKFDWHLGLGLGLIHCHFCSYFLVLFGILPIFCFRVTPTNKQCVHFS